METRVAYATVGVFVLILSAALIALGLWLGADVQTRQYKPYMFLTTESAAGINPGSVVRYRGVEVGRVKSLSLENPEQVRIVLDIEQGTPIKTDTRASIATQGVTGLAFIELSGGTLAAPDLEPGPNGEPALLAPAPSLLRRLDVALSRNLENLDEIAAQVQDLLNEDNRESFGTLLRNVALVSETLAQERAQIGAVLANGEKMTRAGTQAFEQLPSVMAELEATLREVRSAAANFRDTSTALREAATSTQKELGGLRRSLEPKIDALVDQIDQTADGIDALSRTLRRDPAQFVRGAPVAPPGPGEE
ncbi:MAG: MlaD family protein [Pseudomonadota bacterium]